MKYLNEIVCGDCLDILKELPDKSIRLIIQDPPYNITDCEWEYDITKRIDELWKEWKRVLMDDGAIVMTASQPFTSKMVLSNPKMFNCEWIWEKTNTTGFLNAKRKPLKAHESVLVFSKMSPVYNPQMTEGKPYVKVSGKSSYSVAKHPKIQAGGHLTVSDGKRYPKSVIKIKNAEKGLHPTQKPVELMKYFIKTYSNENDIVFDGYAGSGTTAVACIELNRKFICVDISPEYCEIAKKRINDLQRNLTLWE